MPAHIPRAGILINALGVSRRVRVSDFARILSLLLGSVFVGFVCIYDVAEYFIILLYVSRLDEMKKIK